jgi:tRNA-2-methylthio-N6-dimethylallyladenosine synthase
LELTEFARFDMIYIGIYSPRPGTYAEKHYKDDIPQQEKKRRWKVLNDLLQKISYENNLKEI